MKNLCKIPFAKVAYFPISPTFHCCTALRLESRVLSTHFEEVSLAPPPLQQGLGICLDSETLCIRILSGEAGLVPDLVTLKGYPTDALLETLQRVSHSIRTKLEEEVLPAPIRGCRQKHQDQTVLDILALPNATHGLDWQSIPIVEPIFFNDAKQKVIYVDLHAKELCDKGQKESCIHQISKVNLE